MLEKPIIERFARAQTVAAIWSASRQLMAAKQLSEYVDTPAFLDAFSHLEKLSRAGPDVERLLAVDLLVRLPSASKKLADRGVYHLKEALTTEIPPLNIINSASLLPEQAKPADIRENIALGLKYATGDWVGRYLVTSIMCEQQSQRTREVLVNELAVRTDDLSDLLQELTLCFSSEPFEADRLSDLSSVCQALTKAISQDRQIIHIHPSSPQALDTFAGTLVKYSGRGAVPPKLKDASIALVKLLDDLLTMEIALFVDAESYRVLARLHRWWNVRSYPGALSFALRPIVSKIIGAITVRARMTQQSQELVGCLRYAVQDAAQATQMCVHIADANTLSADIDDWLRGRERIAGKRTRALRRALKVVDQEDTDNLVGNLLVFTNELTRSLEWGRMEEATRAATSIANRVQSVAVRRGLRVEGSVGEVVEYNPEEHDTTDKSMPLSDKVRLNTPMVTRIREDGTRNILIRAIVSQFKTE